MLKRLTALAALTLIGGCSEPRSGENSARCGLTMLAAANLVLDQTNNSFRFLEQAPRGMTGTIPARVVGYGTARASVDSVDSTLVARFEGRGFPGMPGYALALVDDSSEVFRGVLIYEPMPPGEEFPTIGELVGPNDTRLPIFGLRVNWSRVNDETCPLFTELDTAVVADPGE